MWLDDERTALYRLYGEGGALLYVGITHHVEQRFTEHERDKPWWPEVETKAVEWFDTRPLALAAELRAIHDEEPRYNVTGKPWIDARRPLEANEVAFAQLRAELSEHWQRVHYTGQPVFLVDRTKERKQVVALVSMDFYERALAALNEERVLVEKPAAG